MSVRAMPGTVPRTGMPEFRPYVYRRSERRMTEIRTAEQRRRRQLRDRDGFCTECGYRVTAPGHKIECGSGE